MEMNERIQKVLNNSGLSASEFSKRLDIQRSRLSHILSGRNNASLDIIKKINDNFPEYTLDWLINGVEKPLLYPKTQIIDKKIDNSLKESKFISVKLLNASLLLSIMYLIYFREGPIIQFIFIILIRLSLTQINKGVDSLVNYKLDKESLKEPLDEED